MVDSLPKKETIEFVRNNRSLLQEVARNGDPAIRPIATAFLGAVPPEEKGEAQESEPSEERPAADSDTGTRAGLDRYLEGGDDAAEK